MPAYNAGRYIGESIESVINQTYTNWELIIIDDGSTDDTAWIVNTYQQTEHRIKYLFQANNKQGKARNLGITNSSGKYIAFLDADDKWTADKLSTQLQLILSDENTDLLFSQGYSLTGDEVKEYNVVIKDIWDEHNFNEFILNNQIPIPSVLIKKDALEQAGNFTEARQIQNAEDYHLWLKLLANGKRFKSVPDRLFYYRTHPGQVTFQNNNLEKPIFYAYQSIFWAYPVESIRKPIINKIKWLLFNTELHRECVNLIIEYLKGQKKYFLSFIIGRFFTGPKIVSQKMVFKIVSIFG